MKHRSKAQLREDANAIWSAGVHAVQSDRLVEDFVKVDTNRIVIGETEWSPINGGQVWVIGGGKAGSGMVRGLERAFGYDGLQEFQPQGWVNVPADCIENTQGIHLHAARPAGLNEPTPEGVQGTRRILDLVGHARPEDLVICLLSGGGSALLPAPANGISLADKQAVTKFLSQRGANIAELNSVRTALSDIKGGGLARHCGADTLVTLVISDVLGDPLEVIASGPTVFGSESSIEPLNVLRKFDPSESDVPESIYQLLHRRKDETESPNTSAPLTNNHYIIGNNAIAVDAAGMEAERRGYSHAMTSANKLEGEVEKVAHHHARMARRMRNQSGPDCLITGGEPTVVIPADVAPGKGGRNQQLVLEAWQSLVEGPGTTIEAIEGICILSGGTDGEDGPTDAAGGFVDCDVAQIAVEKGLDPRSFTSRYDAYEFLSEAGGLIRTGPTHTNVCDLRVIVVDRIEDRNSEANR